MKIVKLITKVGVGATATVVTVTALPLAGAVGSITAVGASIAAIAGGVAGAVDYVLEERHHKKISEQYNRDFVDRF